MWQVRRSFPSLRVMVGLLDSQSILWLTGVITSVLNLWNTHFTFTDWETAYLILRKSLNYGWENRVRFKIVLGFGVLEPCSISYIIKSCSKWTYYPSSTVFSISKTVLDVKSCEVLGSFFVSGRTPTVQVNRLPLVNRTRLGYTTRKSCSICFELTDLDLQSNTVLHFVLEMFMNINRPRIFLKKPKLIWIIFRFWENVYGTGKSSTFTEPYTIN